MFVCDADDICDCRDWKELVEVNLYIDQSSDSHQLEIVRSMNWVDLASDLHMLDTCEILIKLLP